MSQDNETISQAILRTEHFAKAVLYYKDLLSTNLNFKNNYLKLVEDIAYCGVRHNAGANIYPSQIFFCAIGKSAQVASLATSMFVSVGVLARFIHATEAFHGDLGMIGKNDFFVFISNNGHSEELLQLVPGLKERGVKTYAMTAKPNSPLAKQVDAVLTLPPLEEYCPLQQAPITSTLTSLALCQLLVASSVEVRKFSVEDYAKNHPGGAIGKRIFLKADDLMFKDIQRPRIDVNASFAQIVSSLTHYSKGALLVEDDAEKLLGLITEKDLRRAMTEFGPSVFSKTAHDIMNKTPKTYAPGALAIEVFQFMTQKKPILNVLPIVDRIGKSCGLIHVSELISAGFSLDLS